MTIYGIGKLKNKDQMMAAHTFEEKLNYAMFAENFPHCSLPAVPDLANKGIKLAVNAGASDTELLAQLVDKKIEGDDVTGTVKGMLNKGEGFKSLMHNESVAKWRLDPVCAQCYLGGMGIAKTLSEGADVVIAGRVSDASLIIGAAARALLLHESWWHEWTNDQFDELAGALIIDHLLECAAYVSGGYCSNFRAMLTAGKHINRGFPICTIDNKGEGIMYKERNAGGPQYYNCDVTAQIENIKMEQVGLTGFAGWQAEYHIYLVGLHIEEKCKWIGEQIRYEMGDEMIKRFSLLKFMQNGASPIDARNQDVAAVDFYVFAQSKDCELLNMRNPNGFFRVSIVNFLMSCPGASLGNDVRQAEGNPYYEYHTSLLPQSALQRRVHCIWDGAEGKKIIDMPLAPEFREYVRQQMSYETKNPVPLCSFDPTVRLPLGSIVLGRSGDKCSHCNTGFFVRHDDEYEWLRSLLTIDKIKELLGPEEYKGKPVDRSEMPNIRAVHFLLHDHLDRGFDACSTYDTLGKNCCEYLRAKTVDIAVQFVKRGML